MNRVIPIIDSLENALHQTSRENAAVNALCESLLNSLQKRFGYLLTSEIHLAATALTLESNYPLLITKKKEHFFFFLPVSLRHQLNNFYLTTIVNQAN